MATYDANNQKMIHTLSEKEDMIKVCFTVKIFYLEI